MKMPVKTIEWVDDHIRIIDQTQLPGKLVYQDIYDLATLEEAIRMLRVRGAPAIGVAGAMGMALAARLYRGNSMGDFRLTMGKAMVSLAATRPTAVNLFWTLERMKRVLELPEESVSNLADKLLQEALAVFEEDRDTCRRLGQNGVELLPDEAKVITHCNAGGLATADFGTALGVIYAASEAGKKIHVYADETRPLLQGSRLTAWELMEAGIEVTVMCDSATASLMDRERIDCVIVGADRVTANGDTANKIGTYPLAVLAQRHGIPLYVAAPVSTFDFSLESGKAIPIEQRAEAEVVRGFGMDTAPAGVRVYNPAFDVTPHELVSAFITEAGIHRPPFIESLSIIKDKKRSIST